MAVADEPPLTPEGGSRSRYGCQVVTVIRGKIPTLSFYYAGASSLIGWNIVLTFTHSFDCDMLGGKTFLGASWAFWASFVYSLALNLIQLVMTSRKLSSNLPFQLKWNLSSVAMAMSTLALLSCSVLAMRDGLEVNSAFISAMVCIIILGLAAGTIQSAAFGLAGSIAPELSQAIMGGQGLAGLFCSLVGFTVGKSLTGMVFSMVISAAFNLAGLPLYFSVIRRNPFVAAKLNSQARLIIPDEPLSPVSITSPASSVGPPSPNSSLPRRRSSAEILTGSAWPQALTVFLVFSVTFIVFPGVSSRWLPGERVPFLMATFQMVDVMGRNAPRIKGLQVKRGPVVTFFAVLRILFLPFFIFIQRRADLVWAQDALPQFLLMALFAFSNGYVSTLSMMLGPLQTGVDDDEQEPTGIIMSFALVFGIFFGSVLAVPTQIGLDAPADCIVSALQ
eukprot:TRINITY_DN24975_c0_g1_i1.p1 TRINITY_DN24975_c0_g1~~TRINITY_DN24975_c0_g1_i1.p1  ORF type:complete len:448 (-),score=45.08 TRINITY_DN24975_c0_g1_i1:450-1793(-)